jgi:hypothetical protein
MNHTSTALAAAALLGAASPALAGTQTFSGVVTGNGGNWIGQALVPRFDDQGGDRILESVVFEMLGVVTLDAGVENRDASPATIDLNLFGNVQVAMGADVLAIAEPTLSETYAMAAYDEVLDFAGASGLSVEDMTAALGDTSTRSIPEEDLSDWIGSDPLALDVTAKAMSWVTGGGNLTTLLRTEAALEWSVTYVYRGQIIPAPQAAGLGLLGLLGVASPRRRRRVR